jgi:5-methylcytosine-specific restriction protein A
MLGNALQKIGREYRAAKLEKFAGHPLAAFIRTDATQALESALGIQSQSLICKGSAGTGNFATVPWLAMFDPLVTATARDGYYVVFLYSADGTLYLSLNQGATAVRREFRGSTPKVLSERAALIRARLEDYREVLPLSRIELGSEQQLPQDYEAGHALGLRYGQDQEFNEERILSDLASAISAYRALIFRGGLDPSPEGSDGAENEMSGTGALSLEEIRRYRFHRKIERNPRAAGLVKAVRGMTCEACEFNFEMAYGDLGKGYIEAHHLRPLSSLQEGQAVNLTAIDDFVVLCSNCHRMVHRMADPSNIAALRQLLKH